MQHSHQYISGIRAKHPHIDPLNHYYDLTRKKMLSLLEQLHYSEQEGGYGLWVLPPKKKPFKLDPPLRDPKHVPRSEWPPLPPNMLAVARASRKAAIAREEQLKRGKEAGPTGQVKPGSSVGSVATGVAAQVSPPILSGRFSADEQVNVPAIQSTSKPAGGRQRTITAIKVGR